ncbi:MAG TPA: hypothetical protein VF529_14825 [Solirubrobacteraceae bacterium]
MRTRGGAPSRLAALAFAAWLLLAGGQASAHYDVLPSCGGEQPPPSFEGNVETSPNVDHLGWLAGESADLTPGGRRVGDRFYVTGQTHFSVYDISDPPNPKLLSRVNYQCRFENEDVASDGRSLVYSDFATSRSLFVYDVRNAKDPKLLAEVPEAGTHTATCVLDCRYLFGSYKVNSSAGPNATGQVVDLSDPSSPKVLGDWTDNGVLPSRKVHDVTEIAPGLVLTASAPIELLDVRRDPVKPDVLAQSPEPEKRWHSVEWPRQGLDRFVLATFETNATPRCEAGGGDFAVFDTSRTAETGELERRGTWLLSNTNDDRSSGNPSVNAGLGCSPHWFNVRPSWHDGGVVAMGAYDHGVKFLRVDPMGGVTEIGHFRAPGTNASAAYWITCDIVYVVDYTRGFDVLRFRDAASACPAGGGSGGGSGSGGGDGGGGAGSTPSGGGGPGAFPTGRLEPLGARVRARWRVRRRFSQLRRLTVTDLPLASSVRIVCRGPRCPLRSRGVKVRRGRAATRKLRRVRFLPGSLVQVRISRPGAETQLVGWRILRGKPPRRTLPG